MADRPPPHERFPQILGPENSPPPAPIRVEPALVVAIAASDELKIELTPKVEPHRIGNTMEERFGTPEITSTQPKPPRMWTCSECGVSFNPLAKDAICGCAWEGK